MVSANNLKEVVVTFNKDIDAANAGTYTFDTASGLTVASKVVSGKTVTLTLTGKATQQQAADLTADGVKTVDGVAVAKTVKTVKFVDVDAPTVSGVAVTAPGVITVSFSEPLKDVPTFKVDNGQVAITNSPFLSNDGKSVSLNLGVATEGSHTVTVSGGMDFAGFKVESVDKAFTYVKDVTAPAFTVKSISERQLVLQFDEAISNATDANVVFSHTYKDSYKDTVGSRVLSNDGKTLTLSFANPIPTGNVTFYLGYTTDTAAKIQDSWGNKLAATSFTANLVSDTTAPTVSKVEAVSNTSIEVTYSEAVTGADSAANYTLKDTDGKAVPFTVALVSGNKYAVNPTSPLNGGNYTLTVKNVVDSSFNLNKLTDYTTNVSVADKVAPTIVDVNTATQGTTDVQLLTTKKVKIAFSEAMDASTITNKNNYAFNGVALDSNVTLTAVDNNKAVVLDFTNVTSGTQMTPAGQVITVGRVADAAGNYTALFSQPVTVQNNVSAPLFKEADVVDNHTVKFNFDEAITSLSAADFLISNDSGANYSPATSISVSVVDGKTVVTATTNLTLSATATGVVVTTANAATGKNAFGSTIAIANNTAVVDKFGPTALTAAAMNSINNAFVDQIVLTYSEPLYAASVQDSDFTVAGYQVTGVQVGTGSAANTVTLSVKEHTVNDLSATPSVTQVGAVEDLVRNATATSSAIVATSVDSALLTNPTVGVWASNKDVPYTDTGVTPNKTYLANTIFQANVNFAGKTGADFKSAEVSLYNGTTLLATNTAKATTLLVVGNTSITALFGEGDVANTSNDPDWNIGAYTSNQAPTKAVFTLVDQSGVSHTVTTNFN
jgi:hypothetical protein